MPTLRVVLDTSALMTQAKSGLTSSLLWMLMREGSIRPVVSMDTYRHFRRVLGEARFGLTEDGQNTILAEYLYHAEFDASEISPVTTICTDPRHVPFVELAVAKEVNALVTVAPRMLAYNGSLPCLVCDITGLHQLIRSA